MKQEFASIITKMKGSQNANSSNYRIPCVYCDGNTAFASSMLLKEHLLSAHTDVMDSPLKYGKTVKDLKVKEGKSTEGMTYFTTEFFIDHDEFCIILTDILKNEISV